MLLFFCYIANVPNDGYIAMYAIFAYMDSQSISYKGVFFAGHRLAVMEWHRTKPPHPLVQLL